MSDLPIKLRHTIIYPTIIYPKQYVGIQIIISLCAACVASDPGSRPTVTIDSKRRHTEFHPRLDASDRIVQLPNQYIDIVSAPIILVRESFTIQTIFAVIVNCLSCHTIRIKIVIYVQTVNIITAHNVISYTADIFAIERIPRIEDKQSVISKYTSGMLDRHVARRQGRCPLSLGTIRIDPRV